MLLLPLPSGSPLQRIQLLLPSGACDLPALHRGLTSSSPPPPSSSLSGTLVLLRSPSPSLPSSASDAAGAVQAAARLTVPTDLCFQELWFSLGWGRKVVSALISLLCLHSNSRRDSRTRRSNERCQKRHSCRPYWPYADTVVVAMTFLSCDVIGWFSVDDEHEFNPSETKPPSPSFIHCAVSEVWVHLCFSCMSLEWSTVQLQKLQVWIKQDKPKPSLLLQNLVRLLMEAVLKGVFFKLLNFKCVFTSIDIYMSHVYVCLHTDVSYSLKFEFFSHFLCYKLFFPPWALNSAFYLNVWCKTCMCSIGRLCVCVCVPPTANHMHVRLLRWFVLCCSLHSFLS